MEQYPSYQVPHEPESPGYGCLAICALGSHAIVLTGFLLYGIWLIVKLLNDSFQSTMPIRLIELTLIVLLWSAVVHLFDRVRWAWRLTLGVYGVALALATLFRQPQWLIVIVPLSMLLPAKHQFAR